MELSLENKKLQRFIVDAMRLLDEQNVPQNRWVKFKGKTVNDKDFDDLLHVEPN